MECVRRDQEVSRTLIKEMDAKGAMRRAAYDARNAQTDKDSISQIAVASLMQLPEYQAAQTVLWYLDCRSELRTRHALPAALASGKQIVVPYCTANERGENKLGLWWLQALDELVVGKWKILEPPRERWEESGREIRPDEIDFVVVPGVAFGRDGARMGNGQGYYDRLLESVRPDCPLVGLCFESQLFDNLIVSPHDVFMDKVVTERAVYEGRGRRSKG
jgi:5-formyltetrahydrofolate cyclo-ligase